jgi:hypothetical protein
MDEAADEAAGDKVTECLLHGDEILARRTVHDGARVKAVFGAKHGLERISVPNFDGTLDDDVEQVRCVFLPDDHLVRTEIPNV